MNKSEVTIRIMESKDICRVAQLEEKYFSEPWSAEAIKESFANNSYSFIVAVYKEIIVGYMGLYTIVDEANITNIVVDEEYRKKGVGAALLDKAFQIAKEKGASEMVLEVRVSNRNAINLYEKKGFENSGIRRKFYSNPTEDAIIMWKHNI